MKAKSPKSGYQQGCVPRGLQARARKLSRSVLRHKECVEENLLLAPSSFWRLLAWLGLWPPLFVLSSHSLFFCASLTRTLVSVMGYSKHPNNWGWLSHLNSLNLMTSAKTFFLSRHVHGTHGLGHDSTSIFWGPPFSLLRYLKGWCYLSQTTVLIGWFPCRKIP